MKRYYVQNGKIVINKYAVRYERTINNVNSETESKVLHYVADDMELKGLTGELDRNGIDYTVINLDTEDIFKI